MQWFAAVLNLWMMKWFPSNTKTKSDDYTSAFQALNSVVESKDDPGCHDVAPYYTLSRSNNASSSSRRRSKSWNHNAYVLVTRYLERKN